MAVVFIPTPLRKYADGQTSIIVPGTTLRELINNLEERYPGFKERFLDPDDDDRLMPGLAAFVQGEPTNMGLRTKLEEDDEVHFLPAIAGGSPGPRRS